VDALNRNFATYQVEKEARINTSFTLYNRRAVENLMNNDEHLLPLPTEGSRAWQAMMNKDLRWNQQKINSSLIQGILQGDSIPEISDRLLNIVGMNEVSARRSARTMMTSVENKARDDSYEELKGKGVELETVWLATLDDRTRHSHRQMHGEVRGENGRYSNGLRFPADPAGAPEEVYNCRCCEFSHVKGFPIDIPKWSPKMGDMTFEEWLGEHEENAAEQGAFIAATNREEATNLLTKLFHVEDNVKYIDDELYISSANRITELNKRFGAISEDNNGFITSSNVKKAVAASKSSFRRDNVDFYLCRDYYGSLERLAEEEDKALKKKWCMPFSEEFKMVYTVTHEYGHALQSLLMKEYIDIEQFETEYKKRSRADIYGKKATKYLRDTEKKAAKDIWKEIVDIARENNENFSIKDNLSEYGRSDYFEAFAETFANSQCGEPNELGNAMSIWLERKGF
jgi:SPP1 gp7 family putative phage head morphogenesis protein